MSLLGINAGLGMADVGRLPLSALDLDNAWLDFAPVKTGIPRSCPLWPETVAAIREALAIRPKPKTDEHTGLVFLTRQGTSWHKTTMSSPMCYKFGKLLRQLHINRRKRLGFYTLRHSFRTIADGCRDQVAANHIMGHADGSMAAAYREVIDEARLKAVVDHVRAWLFDPPAQTTSAEEVE